MVETSLKAAGSTPKRDLLLDTAAKLFYRNGYHAVGIDTILGEAGLAKMTLYHHFSSKEELIVAALERRGRAVGEAISTAIEAAGGAPRKRLLAIFDWYEQWFDSKDFNGCAFIRAVGEYPEIKSPIHQMVMKQKQAGRDRIEALLAEMKVSGPAKMASQIYLLLEGAIVSAHTFGDSSIIKSARDAALALIKADVG
jgi:AcrR family transcriptional regulator